MGKKTATSIIGEWCLIDDEEKLRAIYKEDNTFIPVNIIEGDSTYGEDAYEILADTLLRVYPKNKTSIGLTLRFAIIDDTLRIRYTDSNRIVSTWIRCKQ